MARYTYGTTANQAASDDGWSEPDEAGVMTRRHPEWVEYKTTDGNHHKTRAAAESRAALLSWGARVGEAHAELLRRLVDGFTTADGEPFELPDYTDGDRSHKAGRVYYVPTTTVDGWSGPPCVATITVGSLVERLSMSQPNQWYYRPCSWLPESYLMGTGLRRDSDERSPRMLLLWPDSLYAHEANAQAVVDEARRKLVAEWFGAGEPDELP